MFAHQSWSGGICLSTSGEWAGKTEKRTKPSHLEKCVHIVTFWKMCSKMRWFSKSARLPKKRTKHPKVHIYLYHWAVQVYIYIYNAKPRSFYVYSKVHTHTHTPTPHTPTTHPPTLQTPTLTHWHTHTHRHIMKQHGTGKQTNPHPFRILDFRDCHWAMVPHGLQHPHLR